MTAEIVDFLTARWDEEEAVIEDRETWTAKPEAHRMRRVTVDYSIEYVVACTLSWRGTHIARHDPAHVLADIKAKRAIVDAWRTAHDTVSQPGCPDDRRIGEFDGLDEAVRHLAAVYEQHPEYKAEWRT